MSKLMTASEYAAHRGITAVTVSKALQIGRITAKKKGNAYQIDPVKADAQWAANTRADHKDSSVKVDHRKKGDDKPTYTESRAIKEEYAARLKKLEYEKEIGNLVSAEDVERDAYDMARSTQSQVMSVPDRVAGQLVGMTSIVDIKTLLKRELRQALTTLGDMDD